MKYFAAVLALACLASCTMPEPATTPRVAAWKALHAQDDAAVVPTSRVLTYPSAEEWAMISKRAAPSATADPDDDK